MTMSRSSDLGTGSEERRRARRGLAIFVGLVVAFEAVVVTAMVVTGMFGLVVLMDPPAPPDLPLTVAR